MRYLKGYRAFLLESGQQDDWMERSDPIRTITHMSKSRDWQPRSMAAENPKCPPDILEKLSRDPDELVRSGVARNPKTKFSILSRLAGEDNAFINKALLKNPRCPDRILYNIVTLGNISISGLRPVVNHPNVSIETLVKLSTSSRDRVAAELAKDRLEYMISELEASGNEAESQRIQNLMMLNDFNVSTDPSDEIDLGEIDI